MGVEWYFLLNYDCLHICLSPSVSPSSFWNCDLYWDGPDTDVQETATANKHDFPTNKENYNQGISHGRYFSPKGMAINRVTEDRRTSWDMETVYNTTIEDMLLDVANLIWRGCWAQPGFNSGIKNPGRWESSGLTPIILLFFFFFNEWMNIHSRAKQNVIWRTDLTQRNVSVSAVH